MSLKVTVVMLETQAFATAVIGAYSNHKKAAAVAEALESVYAALSVYWHKIDKAELKLGPKEDYARKLHRAQKHDLMVLANTIMSDIAGIKILNVPLHLDKDTVSFTWETSTFTNATLPE